MRHRKRALIRSYVVLAPALAFLISVGVVACAPGECDTAAPAVDTAAEESAIMALESEWSDMFAAGDVDGIMNLHAPDAVQLPPGAGPVIGSEALRAAWEGMATTEGLEISWKSTLAKVSQGGDMAYDYGTASMTTPDGTTQAMKYLVVWIRVDGEWKVAADMFNSNEAS